MKRLDYGKIRENPEEFQDKIEAKGYDGDIQEVLDLEEEHRQVVTKINELREEHNKASDARDIEKGKKLKKKISEKEKEERQLKEKLKEKELEVPNTIQDDVPLGAEENNEVLDRVGDIPRFDFEPKDHTELGENLGILDLERGAKTSGARFYFLKEEAVLLQRALVNWAIDELRSQGFDLMVPPHLVKREVMEAGGFVPKGEDDIYRTEKDDLYLTGTAEQSLLGYRSDEILEPEELPQRFVGLSTSYRREAGSHGKDTRGIIRVHQFDKLEMFSIVAPENAEEEHDFLLGIEKDLMDKLGMPYQSVLLASGDTAFASTKTFDIETWLPSQEKYIETHSCSNTTDFQTRRANIRYRNEEGETDYPYALNGTALAVPRMLVTIWENYQNKDGSIEIPEVLQGYTGFHEIRS